MEPSISTTEPSTETERQAIREPIECDHAAQPAHRYPTEIVHKHPNPIFKFSSLHGPLNWKNFPAFRSL